MKVTVRTNLQVYSVTALSLSLLETTWVVLIEQLVACVYVRTE